MKMIKKYLSAIMMVVTFKVLGRRHEKTAKWTRLAADQRRPSRAREEALFSLGKMFHNRKAEPEHFEEWAKCLSQFRLRCGRQRSGDQLRPGYRRHLRPGRDHLRGAGGVSGRRKAR